MNPIEYLVKEYNFRITSDPTKYLQWYPDGPAASWGYRNYWEEHNGEKIYHDSYCGGWHRAYDLSIKEGTYLPAVVDGIIVSGTSSKGNFGGTVVLADHEGDFQYIYGHCKNLQVKVGDTVKQGDTLAEQSNTNYYNNPMNSHLHFQVQKQEFIPTEKEFVCTGINPLDIDVYDYTDNAKSINKNLIHTVVKGDTLWALSKTYNTTVDEIRDLNQLKSDTLSIDQKLVVGSMEGIHIVAKRDTLWALSQKYNTTVAELKSINSLKSDTLSIGQVLKVNGSLPKKEVEKPKKEPKKTFDPNKNNKLSDKAYFTGVIDDLGANVRNRKGSSSHGYNWNTQAGYDLKAGDTIYVFETSHGWYRIYTSRTSGDGANEWVWSDRVDIKEIF